MAEHRRADIDELNSQSWLLAPSHPARALELARDAEARSSDSRYSAGEATARLNAGWACVYLGRLDEALTFIYSARSFFEATDDAIHLSEAINALGVIAQRLSEYDLALDHLQLALQLAITSDNPERRVAALNNLGELHEKRGALDEASHCFGSAGSLAEEYDITTAVPVISCNQARVLLRRGELGRCREELDRSLETACVQGDRVTEAEVLQLMAALQQASGGSVDDSTAEDLYLESLSIAQDLGMPDSILRALLSLSELYLDGYRLQEAVVHVESAAEFVTTAQHLRSAAPVYRRLADLLDEQADLESAVAVLRALDRLNARLDGTGVGRRAQTLRHYYQLEQAHRVADTIRERNLELQGDWESLSTENSMLHLLYRIGSELTASLDMSELSQRLYARINETMPADVFGLASYNQEEETLEFTHVVEQNQRLTPFSVPVDLPTSFGGWVIRSGKEVLLSDANKEYRRYVSERKPFATGDSRSLIFLPLGVEERIIGVLTVQSYRKNAYSSEQIDFLRMLAPYLAIAMDNSQKMETIVSLNTSIREEKQALEEAYQQINHMANHDTLTGLSNRRLVTELVTEHVRLAERQGALFGLLYLDLDKFKPINDTHGHVVGDQVLVEIARRLQGTVRQSDSVARLGGDEFLVLVRDIANEEAIVHIAEKVHSALLEPIQFDGHAFSLTVSIGVSIFPRHGSTFHSLVTVADRAMYKSKQGNNSFVSVG
jgi:diguanylate cyclase (GGDEF)-like protein